MLCKINNLMLSSFKSKCKIENIASYTKINTNFCMSRCNVLSILHSTHTDA